MYVRRVPWEAFDALLAGRKQRSYNAVRTLDVVLVHYCRCSLKLSSLRRRASMIDLD